MTTLPGCLALLALVLPLLGCKSSFDRYCSTMTECFMNNDKDKQACIDVEEGKKRAAEDYGCGSQYDAYVTCINADATCSGGFFATPDCSAAEEAAQACMNAASGEQ